MNTDKWATSKSTQLSTKIWVKLLLLLEDALKLNFENLHPHRIGQKNNVLIYHDMHWSRCYRSKTPYHTEKQGFGYPGFQNKIQDTLTKTGWSWAQFQKGQPTPCKTTYMLFPAHFWVRELWPQIYSLAQALSWALLSKILANTKMGAWGLECRNVNFLEYLGQGTHCS